MSWTEVSDGGEQWDQLGQGTEWDSGATLWDVSPGNVDLTEWDEPAKTSWTDSTASGSATWTEL